jgi:lipopolysaccharide biosynthesis glycosyltransferase
MENLFAPCNSLRFGLPQLLKDYTRVISLDTDILFFRDVRILWNQFNLFNEKTSLAAAPCVHEGGRRYAVKISRHLGVRIDKKEVERVPSINGGVLLMDLTKLRQAWSKDWFSRVDKYGSEISARPCQVS